MVIERGKPASCNISITAHTPKLENKGSFSANHRGGEKNKIGRFQIVLANTATPSWQHWRDCTNPTDAEPDGWVYAYRVSQ